MTATSIVSNYNKKINQFIQNVSEYNNIRLINTLNQDFLSVFNVLLNNENLKVHPEGYFQQNLKRIIYLIEEESKSQKKFHNSSEKKYEILKNTFSQLINKIEKTEGKNFLNFFWKASNVQKLKYSINRIMFIWEECFKGENQENFEKLCEQIEENHPSLKSLDFSEHECTDDEIDQIFCALKKNHTIHVLKIRGGDSQTDSSKNLIDSLNTLLESNSTLKEIYLSNVWIKASGRNLKLNSHLEVFHLTEASISFAHLIEILKSLETNKTLHSLKCEISEPSFFLYSKKADYLNNNKTLKELKITWPNLNSNLLARGLLAIRPKSPLFMSMSIMSINEERRKKTENAIKDVTKKKENMIKENIKLSKSIFECIKTNNLFKLRQMMGIENFSSNIRKPFKEISLLQYAVLCENSEAIEILLQHPDIDIGLQDKFGLNALDLAKEMNHTKIISLLENSLLKQQSFFGGNKKPNNLEKEEQENESYLPKVNIKEGGGLPKNENLKEKDLDPLLGWFNQEKNKEISKRSNEGKSELQEQSEEILEDISPICLPDEEENFDFLQTEEMNIEVIIKELSVCKQTNDELREKQEQLEKKLSEACEETRDHKIDIEKLKLEILLLQKEQEVLVEKQKFKEGQKNYLEELLKTPQLADFYQTLFIRLKCLLVSAKAGAGPLVKTSEGSLGEAAANLESIGNIVGAIPVFGEISEKVLNIAAKPLEGIDEERQKNSAMGIVRLEYNLGKEKIVHETTRLLTECLSGCLKKLSLISEEKKESLLEKGKRKILKKNSYSDAEKFADYVWMIIYDTLAKKKLDFKKRSFASLMIEAVLKKRPTKSGNVKKKLSWAFRNQMIKIQKEEKIEVHTVRNFLTKTAIMTEEGDLYYRKGVKGDHETFGVCLVTKEIVQTLINTIGLDPYSQKNNQEKKLSEGWKNIKTESPTAIDLGTLLQQYQEATNFALRNRDKKFDRFETKIQQKDEEIEKLKSQLNSAWEQIGMMSNILKQKFPEDFQ